MSDEELREIERQIAIGATLPGRDRYALDTMAALVAEVRRRGAVIVQMQHALDYLGDSIDQEHLDTYYPVGAEQGAPRLRPGEEP